ncbi:hypothetical protein [Streptosporangium vulgare]|uniref:hypothetical protein n=1 Tax=Streptosporangium vulgare TaxID=46190 RepID=UPI0031DBFA30
MTTGAPIGWSSGSIGAGGTATDVATGQTVQRDVWSYYGLQRLAGESTIFVAPQGIGNGWANSGGEDVTFVDDMIRRIEGDLCVETTQRFALGFSYGGAMSFALACARPTVFPRRRDLRGRTAQRMQRRHPSRSPTSTPTVCGTAC